MEARIKELYATLEVKLGAVMLGAPNESLHTNVWDVIYNNEAQLAELLALGHSESDVESNLKDAVVDVKQEVACSAEYEVHYQ